MYESIFKSWFTSVIGAIAITLSLFGWWYDKLSDFQGVALFIIGFGLLWMRDKISVLIEDAVKAAINKYSGK
jgi:TRAP-type uncharacterized transport system fused permease subunit